MSDTKVRSPYEDIIDERKRQDIKWGIQKHPHPHWLCILSEEVGELAKVVTSECIAPLPSDPDTKDMRYELVQIAAVAVAWIEHMDREAGL